LARRPILDPIGSLFAAAFYNRIYLCSIERVQSCVGEYKALGFSVTSDKARADPAWIRLPDY
jgi:hypothetical protein